MKNLIFLFLFVVGVFQAQVNKKSVYVKYTQDDITIDATLDEKAWSLAEPAKDFYNYFPSDTTLAKAQTEIRFLFDDENLYVGIKVYAAGNDYIVPSLRRDFRASGNDNITLLFDTFNDATNAFVFGSNPMGVKREILLAGGGNDVSGFNIAWDAKWFAESKIHDNYYILEWAIPLYAFKYREGETQWRFNSYHFDTQTNERNTWINIPQNQPIFSLAYMGDMIFERPLGKSKSPIWVAPFVNGFSGKDYESNQVNNSFSFGGDARLTVGNSMNLDLTVNPDFSQVEVDQQVTNLTRFEIGLPERRQFFIENSDLFGDFGNDRDSNPFFSRRIGIAKNKDGKTIENKIIAGARLSGKLNNNLRVGLLNMQTQEDLENEIPSVNNMVISLQQKVFSRSNLNFLFINKQATKDYAFLAPEDRYNRVVGVDYRLASADNTWSGRYFFHKSFSPGVSSKDFSAGFNTAFNNRRLGIRLSGVFVGDNYRSDLGFIRRTDIFKANPQFEVKFWPEKGAIQRHALQFIPIFLWRPELNFELSDYTIITRWRVNFRNTSELRVSMFNRLTKLYNPFDPTGTEGGIELPGNEKYYYTNLEVDYQSDRRKVISYQFAPSIGRFYNGHRYSAKGSLNWRAQPYLSGSIQMQMDRIELPAPYPSATILLVGPRFDVTFSKSMFWATFIQYSNQRQNFSINTRLQWRFAPLSDLFIVYNDNYDTTLFSPRFRSINLKLTYWLNI